MKHLDLFSGIGGFALAAQWAGFETVAFCEIEDYPRKVLEKNFPGVPIHRDIRNLMVDANGSLFYIHSDGSVSTNRGNDMSCKRDPKYDDAVSLYESGLSIGDCAEFYEVTRQAMHKILKRRGCNFRSQKKHGSDNHFYRGGKTTGQKRAGHLVETAIKKGVLVQQHQCEKCNATKTFSDGRSGIQAHHDDYTKPLEVRWLCQSCHHEWHKTNSAKGGNQVSTATRLDLVTGGYP